MLLGAVLVSGAAAPPCEAGGAGKHACAGAALPGQVFSVAEHWRLADLLGHHFWTLGEVVAALRLLGAEELH